MGAQSQGSRNKAPWTLRPSALVGKLLVTYLVGLFPAASLCVHVNSILGSVALYIEFFGNLWLVGVGGSKGSGGQSQVPGGGIRGITFREKIS